MKIVFSRWCMSGNHSLILDLEALLTHGVSIGVYLDAHQYSASMEILYPNGDEQTIVFDDVHGREEDYPSGLKWFELEQRAIKDGDYKLDSEFWRAYEYLTATPSELEEEVAEAVTP